MKITLRIAVPNVRQSLAWCPSPLPAAMTSVAIPASSRSFSPPGSLYYYSKDRPLENLSRYPSPIKFLVNVIPTPCSDQPSHSQEQSTKRVVLEDLRCGHNEENNSSSATICAALKIRAVPGGGKTCKYILSFKECLYAIKPRYLKTIGDALQCTFEIYLIDHHFDYHMSHADPNNVCKIIPEHDYYINGKSQTLLSDFFSRRVGGCTQATRKVTLFWSVNYSQRHSNKIFRYVLELTIE